MKKKNNSSNLSSKKKPSGNQTEASKKYKDPVGNKEPSKPSKNSGYDEKQPK